MLDSVGATEVDPLLLYFVVPYRVYSKWKSPQTVKWDKVDGRGSRAENAAREERVAKLLARVRQYVVTKRAHV